MGARARTLRAKGRNDAACTGVGRRAAWLISRRPASSYAVGVSVSVSVSVSVGVSAAGSLSDTFTRVTSGVA